MRNTARRGARLTTASFAAGLLATVMGGGLMLAGGTASADPTPDACTPADAWTETTTVPGVQPPDGRPWRVVETVVVEDQAAYDEVVVVDWTNWVWHPTSSWEEPTDGLGPYFPDDDHEGGWWTSNEGNHQGHPDPGSADVNARGNYFRSHGSHGNGDWFHWEAVTETVHHEAVTHEAHLYALDHAAVVCPPTTPTTQPPEVVPTTGTATPTPEATEEPEAAQPEAEESQEPEVLGEQAAEPSAPTQQEQVPTVVDAGYAGQPSDDGRGAALVAGGLLLMTAAGAVAAARRT